MIVLAIDGALGAFSGAVVDAAGAPRSVSVAPNLALEQGLGAVRDLLEKAGTKPDAIDRIAVGIGPGSFTGTRIAISFAKSLAQGWRRPLIGVSSFDALEEGIARDGSVPLLTVVRGRAGIVSVRLRIAERELRASGSPSAVLTKLGDALGVGTLQVAGYAEDVRSELGERGIKVQLARPQTTPAALAIARIAMRREPLSSLHELRADYGEISPARSN